MNRRNSIGNQLVLAPMVQNVKLIRDRYACPIHILESAYDVTVGHAAARIIIETHYGNSLVTTLHRLDQEV